MNADVGTDALEQTTAPARDRVWPPSTAALQSHSAHAERADVLDHLRGAWSPRVSRAGTRGNTERCEERVMKKIVVWGGLLLALGTVGRLLWQARRVSSAPGDVPLPLPPCMYTYRDVTVSLN